MRNECRMQKGDGRMRVLVHPYRFLVLISIFMIAGKSYAQAPFNLVNPLPAQSPAWPEGYQIRWPVRIIGEAPKLTAQSILVSLPTGGWLKPDASDLVVLTAEGK